MTSLTSDLKHKQPEHDAIQCDINAWLSKGHVIERLGNTPMRPERGYTYNNSQKKEAK